MSYRSITDHQSMALDTVRNEAYLRALEAVITPESVVLDLGAGLGTLGLLAAKLGARKVYLVEPEGVISLARHIAKDNGLEARIEAIQGRIEEIDLPESVDVITSVMTGNFLLAEDLLPSLFHARDRYLKPGGTLLPSAAVMEVVPVEHAERHGKAIGAWAEPHLGLDVHAGQEAAANTIDWGREQHTKAEALAPAADLWSLDLRTATSTDCTAEATTVTSRAGTLHGWLGWFRMRLGDAWLSTSPFEPEVHWGSAFLPLAEPVAVAPGEALGFSLRRPPEGDWTWASTVRGATQRQSTFFSHALAASDLRRLAEDGRPTLAPGGLALVRALAELDGDTTLAEAAATLEAAAPRAYPTRQAALAALRAFVAKHGEATDASLREPRR